MELKNKVIVVTGGASGIGKAIVERFAEESPKAIVNVDLHPGPGIFQADVGREDEIQRIVRETEAKHGPIDLFVSNAGILPVNPSFDDATSSPDADWHRAMAINMMSHLWAARALLPAMIARKSGYFLNTVSAAGLLSQIGATIYSTTKHAAIGFAESLAITHKDDGIRVSVLCPQAVGTAMIEGKPLMGADVDGVVTAERVAECALEGITKETFLILPHPNVAKYIALKAENYDRWIGGMAKMRRGLR